MLMSYLKIAYMHMKRHKMISFIHISGLAIGLACCMLICLYIFDELSYDRFHEKSDRIHRTIIDEFVDGQREHNVGSPDLLGPALVQEYPEIISHVRLFHPNWIDKWTVSHGGKTFYEEKLFFADSTIFQVFTFPLSQGDPNRALAQPKTAVITEEMAVKYFGAQNPMGKILSIDNQIEVKITGVVKNVPHNTHFRFNFLVSFEAMPFKWALNTWRTQQFYTYLLLDNAYSQEILNKKLSELLKKYFGQRTNLKVRLQPLTDIHLHSQGYSNDMAVVNSDISYVYIFSAVAVLVLLIACMNFMNLSTAQSTNRAKEIGIRKISGAYRSQMIRQFLGEATFLSFISFILALILVRSLLPTLNQLTDKNIILHHDTCYLFLGFSFCLTLLVGLISGIYPALFLSRFQPIRVLKNQSSGGANPVLFRKTLVVCQFIISVSLIISTLMIYRQINYCIHKNLGFEKEHIMVLPLRDTKSKANYEIFKNDILHHPLIVNVGGSSTVPGKMIGSRGMLPEGNAWYPRNSIFVDYDFIPTLGIEIKEGRNFSRDFSTDRDDAYIVNEAAVRNFGWDSAIGKNLIWAGDANKKGAVIGVVKDFHYESLHQEIDPIVLHMSTGAASYLTIRLKAENIIETVSFIEKEWEAFNPQHPFDYSFLDDHFDKLYHSEKRMGEVFRYFAILGIFISCLGLFGLVYFTTEMRVKEIGVRKVLGSSVSGLVFLLSKEFLKWVLAANIIAWPIVYYAMHRWLQNFAYRTDIELWVFLLSALTVLIIALMTMSFQVIKMAFLNPVVALRYE